MKKKLTLLLVLISSILLSQNKKKYIEYFDNEREIPYLHINKTSFFKGEEIWFKAYILNSKTKKTHKLTSNLHCAIYDETGALKEHKMLFINEGIASGSFLIDSTFTGKKYFIKAQTNYMKNFVEDQSFLQEISIIDNYTNNKPKASTKEKAYDLQILPEGGHLLANTINTFAIILKDKNNKVPKVESVKLINNHKLIEKTTMNQFGMARLTAYIELKEEYSIEIILQNGKKITKKLPPKKAKGLTLSVDNISMNLVKFNVRTNKETLKGPLKKYTLFVHNTNHTIKEVVYLKKNTYEYTTIIGKKIISPGTNIVTLFDEHNNPIAERIFFNYQKSLFSDVTLNVSEITKDSLTINIKKKKKDSIKYSLSSTILPYGTKANQPKNTILTNFLFKPYIKGEIPDVTHLFTGANRKKMLELDLLLLTYGWSKYKWSNIYNTPNVERYKFEKGINIKGTINNFSSEKTHKLLLYSQVDNLALVKKLENEKFKFDNLYLNDTSSISFSLLDKKGKTKKTKAYVSSSSFFEKNSIIPPHPFIPENEENKNDTQSIPFIEVTNSNLLDEVEVKAKIAFKNKPIIFGYTNKYKIDEKYSQQLFSFLRFKGFIISQNQFEITIHSKINSRVVRGESTKTRIFIDGFEITQDKASLLDLRYTYLEEFDEIFISNSFNGEIHLYRKKDYLSEKKTASNFFKYRVYNGYSIEKEYYTPKYVSTNTPLFKKYGGIYWQPNITLNKNNNYFQFKIPRLDQDNIIIELEGINSNGALIKHSSTFNNLDIYSY